MPLNLDKTSGRYVHLGKHGFHNLSEITKFTRNGKTLTIEKKDGTKLVLDKETVDIVESVLKKEGK